LPIVATLHELNEEALVDILTKPKNSLVRYLLEKGFDVYITSWKNPGKEDADIGWDDYLKLGIGEAVRVAVRDNGPGLSAEQRERIFEPFYTTRDVGDGVGVGLAYGVVREHGGRISAANHPDGGAIFTVELPGA